MGGNESNNQRSRDKPAAEDKKFAVRLLPRKLKKLSHRTLLYPTSTHFYPTMMMLEVAKTIQIKPETEINPSPGFSTKKISSNRRLQQILHTTLLFFKQKKKKEKKKSPKKDNSG